MNIPEGWPTEEMLFAAREACDDMFQTDFIGAFKAALASAPTLPDTEWRDSDHPLPEDREIEATHPLQTGRFDLDQEARRLVSAKRSKFALIALVRWLLQRAESAPTQLHHELDDADIRAIALDCGFKLKPQTDGLEDLNPYVYRFAREILSTAPRAEDVEALRKRLTPPAQEDEPVAYAAKNFMTGKWGYIWHEKDDVQGWINLQHQSRDDVTYIGPVALYTAPQPYELRKAAEEACSEIEKLLDGKECYLDDALINLRSALEGK